MNQLDLYLISFGIPFALFGLFKAMQFVMCVVNMRKGKVKSYNTTESGMIKKKWVKPVGGQIKTKGGTGEFKRGVGYVWREGLFPVTFIDGKSNSQINLMPTEEDDGSSAKDASNLIVRSYNEGYIDGFKKNKMINNLILIILLASVAGAGVAFLAWQNTSQILNVLRAVG